MERTISINKEKCNSCGTCIEDCFVSCIHFGEDFYPEYILNGSSLCRECQHCITVCPVGAFSLGEIDPGELEETSFVNDEEMMTMIKSRRSVRKYLQKDVPAEKIEKIKEMLSYPPTGGNLENLHFTIVSTKEKMDELRKITYDSIEALKEDSPAYSMTRNLSRESDMVYRNAPAMIVCAVNENKVAPNCETIDPIIALSYFELYAQSLGLGTLWDDFAFGIANTIPEVYEWMEIPDEYTLSFILTFGEPETEYSRVPKKDRHSFKII